MIQDTAAFTEFSRQVGMIVDETSIKTWAANVAAAHKRGELSEEQVAHLREIYKYRWPKVKGK